MNSIFEKFKWLKFVLGGFAILLGVLVIIFAAVQTGDVPVIINIVISTSLLILGLFLLLSSLLTETHKTFTASLVMGSLSLTLGICMLVARFGKIFVIPSIFIVYLLSILTLVLGVAALFKAIFLIVYRERTSLIILMFAVATIAIISGILGLCFAEKLVTLAYVIVGISLVVLGIIVVVFASLSLKKKGSE